MGNGEASPRSTTNFANNHCINGSIICDGTGTTCNNQGGNLLQTMSQANGQAIPPPSSKSIRQLRVHFRHLFNRGSRGEFGILLFCEHDGTMQQLTYPSYDSTTHTMSVTAASARSAAWDIGAYQFASGSSPNPPTGLSATVQ